MSVDRLYPSRTPIAELPHKKESQGALGKFENEPFRGTEILFMWAWFDMFFTLKSCQF